MDKNKQRDPKEDPQAGDLITLTNGKLRRVTARRGGDVDYNDAKFYPHNCWISTWREWCRKATNSEIISRVELGKIE